MFPKRRIDGVGGGGGGAVANLTIDLSSNRLEMVPDDRFADLDVYTLNLSSNALVRLSPDAFRDTLRLVRVDLAHNRLRTIAAAALAAVADSLEVLVVAGNQLGEMETTRLGNVFARLGALRHLDLSRNGLYDLPDLSNVRRLTALDARHNELESLVDTDTLENVLPASLVELYVDDNQLKHIGDNWFENLPNLRYS